ncbi:MAG: hypothetical protein FWB76_02140 [Oscillospiraceae bacterium]|nr:hypothetical protein [Oscillospiraceae bacterium]
MMKKHLLRATAVLAALAMTLVLAACGGTNVNVLELDTTMLETTATTFTDADGVTVLYQTTTIPVMPTRPPAPDAPWAPGHGPGQGGTTAPQNTIPPAQVDPNLTFPNSGPLNVTSIQIMGIDRVGTSAPFVIQQGNIGTPDEQPQRQVVVQTNHPHARWGTDITITSSNANVIQAPFHGLIRALAPGTATITVRSVSHPNVSQSITVTVLGPA